MRLLGPALIAACDQHRNENMQRRRIGRPTRTFDEYVAQELGEQHDQTVGHDHLAFDHDHFLPR